MHINVPLNTEHNVVQKIYVVLHTKNIQHEKDYHI